MKIRALLYLVILMPVLTSCTHVLPVISPTFHFVETKSGSPIPEGKCRITIMRERHFHLGKCPLQILSFNQAMDNKELNVLCYLGTNPFSFDPEQYKDIIAKNKEKLIFKKTDYDALDGFPVILKSYKHRAEFWSTHPQLLWELEHGMIMARRRPETSFGGRESARELGEAVGATILDKLSKKEVIVPKEFFEKNVCSRVIIGKPIAILNIGDKISWDETPGMIDLYVALEAGGGPYIKEEWLRDFLIDEGNEYIFGINALSKGRILEFELREVVKKKVAAIPKKAESPIIPEEQRVASLPREAERPIVPGLKLRDTPKDLGDYDVRRMIEKYNFFEKDLNESGDFPNYLADNGDGTITDRATGLMWQKEGSSSPLYHYKAKKYVSQLNRENFSGYSNWRIPTLEELWSLLEPEKNRRGQYINSVFTHRQSKCWSGDPLFRRTSMRQIVNFERGQVDVAVTQIGMAHVNLTLNERCFVRAVRTMK